MRLADFNGIEGATMKLNGKVVVITGAGNGMGREMTLEALRRGASVFGVDLKPEALAETAKLAGAGAKFASLAMDITNRDQCAELPTLVEKQLGAADVLVNNQFYVILASAIGLLAGFVWVKGHLVGYGAVKKPYGKKFRAIVLRHSEDTGSCENSNS